MDCWSRPANLRAPRYRIPNVLPEKALRISIRIPLWCVIQGCCGAICFEGTETGAVYHTILQICGNGSYIVYQILKFNFVANLGYKACNYYVEKAFLTEKWHPFLTQTAFHDDKRHSACAVSRGPRLSFQCITEY